MAPPLEACSQSVCPGPCNYTNFRIWLKSPTSDIPPDTIPHDNSDVGIYPHTHPPVLTIVVALFLNGPCQTDPNRATAGSKRLSLRFRGFSVANPMRLLCDIINYAACRWLILDICDMTVADGGGVWLCGKGRIRIAPNRMHTKLTAGISSDPDKICGHQAVGLPMGYLLSSPHSPTIHLCTRISIWMGRRATWIITCNYFLINYLTAQQNDALACHGAIIFWTQLAIGYGA